MRRAAATLAAALRFGLVFGLATGLALVADALLMRRFFDPETNWILLVFTLAAWLGGTAAGLIAELIAPRRPSRRLALMLFLLATGVPALAILFTLLSLAKRMAAWIAPPLTVGWLIDTGIAGLTATYIFGVVGGRFLLPFGLIPLLAAAWIFAIRRRD